jgi:D-psicose/D-tagatose/L-ribulose 3-epimerase
MNFGANTWIWTSPLTTSDLDTLVPHVAKLGFDWIEFPIETPDGYDYRRAGELAREHGLGVSVAAAMGPDRDLIHPDAAIRTNGMAFVRHCSGAPGRPQRLNAPVMWICWFNSCRIWLNMRAMPV